MNKNLIKYIYCYYYDNVVLRKKKNQKKLQLDATLRLDLLRPFDMLRERSSVRRREQFSMTPRVAVQSIA